MTLHDVAAVLARTWVRCYTVGLPAAERHARLAEITSDLWEARDDDVDDAGAGAGARLQWRVLSGVHDDLAWRLEHRRPHAFGRIAMATAVALAIVCAWVPLRPDPVPLTNLWSPAPSAMLAAAVVPVSPAGPIAAMPSNPRVSMAVSVPDLSGTWTLDPEQSDSSGLPVWDPRRTVGPSHTLRLEQRDGRLTRTAAGASVPLETATFDLRGGAHMEARGTLVRRATWAGRRLVLVTTRIEKGGAWSTTDVLALTPDKRALLVERINQAGEVWSTYVGRVPDVARARTRDIFVRTSPADVARVAGPSPQP